MCFCLCCHLPCNMLACYIYLLWMFCRSSEVSVAAVFQHGFYNTNCSVRLSRSASPPYLQPFVCLICFPHLGLISCVAMKEKMLAKSGPLLPPFKLNVFRVQQNKSIPCHHYQTNQCHSFQRPDKICRG